MPSFQDLLPILNWVADNTEKILLIAIAFMPWLSLYVVWYALKVVREKK